MDAVVPIQGQSKIAADASNLRLREQFDDSSMNSSRIAAIAVLVALSALDGYDVLSVTFAAPAITGEWGVGKAALGIVLSAGLAGMAIGSFLLAPLADAFGRRKLVLCSLALMAAGMMLSALASALPGLVAWRVMTGLGIGTMVAVINPLAAEFSNKRHRAFAVSLMTIGYPIGGLVGGIAAAYLLKFYAWPAIFLLGACAATTMLPVVLCFLPETLQFLLSRPGGNALKRVNALLAKWSLQTISELPPTTIFAKAGYPGVFESGQISNTIQITLINLLYVVAVYYLFSWLPQIVANSGFSPSSASLVASVMNLSGIVGGIVLGIFSRWARLTRLTIVFMAAAGLAAAAFGAAPASLPLMMVAASACGFFVFGGMAGLYATLAASFTTEARASGCGFVIGVGRVASAAAPAAAGWLFAMGLSSAVVSLAFGGCAIVAGLLLAVRPLVVRDQP